ncbi:MAG: bifunctional precorrin-2 dehydrogenase/sirohydrochlorin ferrochelatase [Candidatus Magnetomorum sp.]|nr:bifunctional precorrin-2 dehydrogenase/sirohydrochlorin ferrochelatase [Candidatus Magnetomorum sp.]
MKYYPININLKHRRCLIVGGGAVAFRKMNRLLECFATVTVISPQFDPEFLDKPQPKGIELIQRTIRNHDLDGFFMVFATTNDAQVNQCISEWAQKKNILCNIADNPETSDFTLPSIIEQGDLNITISTNGKSPALSRHIRKQLVNTFGDEYALFLVIMGNLRDILSTQQLSQDERKKKYHTLIDMQLIHRIKEKDINHISSILFDVTGYTLDEIVHQEVVDRIKYTAT